MRHGPGRGVGRGLGDRQRHGRRCPETATRGLPSSGRELGRDRKSSSARSPGAAPREARGLGHCREATEAPALGLDQQRRRATRLRSEPPPAAAASDRSTRRLRLPAPRVEPLDALNAPPRCWSRARSSRATVRLHADGPRRRPSPSGRRLAAQLIGEGPGVGEQPSARRPRRRRDPSSARAAWPALTRSAQARCAGRSPPPARHLATRGPPPAARATPTPPRELARARRPSARTLVRRTRAPAPRRPGSAPLTEPAPRRGIASVSRARGHGPRSRPHGRAADSSPSASARIAASRWSASGARTRELLRGRSRARLGPPVASSRAASRSRRSACSRSSNSSALASDGRGQPRQLLSQLRMRSLQARNDPRHGSQARRETSARAARSRATSVARCSSSACSAAHGLPEQHVGQRTPSARSSRRAIRPPPRPQPDGRSVSRPPAPGRRPAQGDGLVPGGGTATTASAIHRTACPRCSGTAQSGDRETLRRTAHRAPRRPDGRPVRPRPGSDGGGRPSERRAAPRRTADGRPASDR